MLKVKENQIERKFIACPYCLNPKSETWHLCCSEVHGEVAYELQDGNVYLESELTIERGTQ